MSRLSFQTFCIEFYSHHIKQSSDKVFRLFEREGVLDLLEREYEDLHGMGMEYMMQFLDEYLGERVEKCCIAATPSSMRISTQATGNPTFTLSGDRPTTKNNMEVI